MNNVRVRATHCEGGPVSGRNPFASMSLRGASKHPTGASLDCSDFLAILEVSVLARLPRFRARKLTTFQAGAGESHSECLSDDRLWKNLRAAPTYVVSWRFISRIFACGFHACSTSLDVDSERPNGTHLDTGRYGASQKNNQIPEISTSSYSAGDAATATESTRASVQAQECPKCPPIDMLYAAQRQQCVELVPVTRKQAHSLEADALYCGVLPKNDPIREALTSGHSILQQLTAQNLKLLCLPLPPTLLNGP